MDIFVTGGTGYVGVPIVRQLIQDGHRIRLLTRRPETGSLFSSKVQLIEGNLFDLASLQIGLHGADAVVHLVGIIREQPSKGITMRRVHDEGTALLLQAATSAKVKRFIHMSALGARADAVSDYHRSKWNAEKRVRQSGLDFTIFRPSVVFGAGGPGASFVRQLAGVVRKAPVIPMIGDGSFRLQPVHTSVVADVFAKSLDRSDVVGETFDIGGPEVITYKEILQQIASALSVRKPMVHVPLVMLEYAIRMLGWSGMVPLTMDQLTMLREGNVSANTSRVYERFSVATIPFSVTRSDLD